MFFKNMAFAVAFLLMASSAHGWGNTGHEIICEIAFQEMNRDARDEVKRLIRLDTEYRFFSEACTWPDHPRKRRPEHFVNVPRNFTFIGQAVCPLASSCLFTAIEQDKRILANQHSTDQEKLEALKFLGHWIGDLHQPLHVSFQDDKGGNEINEEGPCDYNLHAIWDTCIVEDELGRDSHEVADKLRLGLTPQQRANITGGGLKDWANGTYQITISPATRYCTQQPDGCYYSDGNRELDDGEPRRTEVIDLQYLEAQKGIVGDQLLKAGVRLGKILNDLLGTSG